MTFILNWLKLFWKNLLGDKKIPTSDPSISPQSDIKNIAQSESEIEEIVQNVIKNILKNHSIRPVYVLGIKSEDQALEHAKTLPLFYVWGQEIKDGDLQFHFSTNGLLISQYLFPYGPPATEKFKQLKELVQHKLHHVVHQALLDECQALETTPREILDEITL